MTFLKNRFKTRNLQIILGIILRILTHGSRFSNYTGTRRESMAEKKGLNGSSWLRAQYNFELYKAGSVMLDAKTK